jgi:hypothetical protein
MGIELPPPNFDRGTSAVTSSKSETRSTLYVFRVHRWRGVEVGGREAPFRESGWFESVPAVSSFDLPRASIIRTHFVRHC